MKFSEINTVATAQLHELVLFSRLRFSEPLVADYTWDKYEILMVRNVT